jgi:UDP-N-acetylglucosamine transferase subunit ALG13
VGTQRFQFNRIFELIDQAIEAGIIKDNVVAQSGYTDYQPRHFDIVPFFTQDQMDDYICKSRCIICHAGVGTITNCLELGKPVIVIPRRKELGEHVDNHQLEISKVFRDNGYVAVAENTEDLNKLIPNIENMNFKPYARKQSDLISSIKNYVNSL